MTTIASEPLSHVISYTPYDANVSKACLLQTDVGDISAGPLQNCAYPSSICPIKAAVVTALAQGAQKIFSVSVHAPDGTVCGCCLDFLRSFVLPNCPLSLFQDMKSNNAIDTKTLSELFPHAAVTPPSPYLLGNWIEPIVANLRKIDLRSVQVEHLGPKSLGRLAVDACLRAYTPVSHFPVGAAMVYKDLRGEFAVAVGGNIEHSRLGAGLCAERSCLCVAQSRGGISKILGLAVCCLKCSEPGSPCGACRQSLIEYGNFPLTLVTYNQEQEDVETETVTISELLPRAFTPASLQ